MSSAVRSVLPWVDSPFFDEELASRPGTDVQRQVAADYHRDGYVIIPDALSGDLIERAVVELDRLFDDEQTRADRRVQDAWEYEGPAREIAIAPGVLDMLRYLYGREPVPFQTLTFQRGTEQRGHADAIHFNTLPPRFMCAVWVALEDIGPEAGALFYYPGSHKLPELAPAHLGQRADEFDYVAYENYLEELMKTLGYQPKTFTAKKGDALLWSSNVVHGGSPILDASSTRRSQVTHYFFEDCVYYTPQFSDVDTGEYHVRNGMVDIRTRKLVRHSYNGRPISTASQRNGRSRLTVEPTALDRVAAGVHEVTAGLPRVSRRAKGIGRRLLKRRNAWSGRLRSR